MTKEIKLPVIPLVKDYKLYIEGQEIEPVKFEEQYTIIHKWDQEMFNSLEVFEQELYRLEYVSVVGIPFINSDWQMETKCPMCGETIKFKGRVDKTTKTINTKINFCKFCGHKINWDVRHLL